MCLTRCPLCLLVALALVLFACSTSPSAGEDEKAPPVDVPLQDADAAGVPDLEEQIADAPGEIIEYSGKVEIGYKLEMLDQPNEKCPTAFAGEATLTVTAKHVPEKGEDAVPVKSMELFFGDQADKAWLVKTKTPSDGVFAFDLDVTGNPFIKNEGWNQANLIEVDGKKKLKDGLLPFALRANLKDSDVVAKDSVLQFKLKLDRTPSKITATSPVLPEGVDRLNVQGSVDVVLSFFETGSGLGPVEFWIDSIVNGTVVKQTLVASVEKASLKVSVTLDLAEVPTGDALLRIVAKDCVGNVGDVPSTPLKVIAVPYFELPYRIKPPNLSEDPVTPFGKIRGIVAPLDGDTDGLDTDGQEDDADEDQKSGVDLNNYGDDVGINDIVFYGDAGLAWARGKKGGTFEPPELIFTDYPVLKAYVLDMTGDKYNDILFLTAGDERKLVLLHKVVTLADDQLTVTTEKFEIAAETKLLPEVTVLAVAGMNFADNHDLFPDVLIGSWLEEYSVAVLLHNGTTDPPPEIFIPEEEGTAPAGGTGAGGKADADAVDGESDAAVDVPPPPITTYFKDPVVLTGPRGLTSIAVGHLNSDSAPDLLLGSGDSGDLSCVVNDKMGTFDIAIWEGAWSAGTGVVATLNGLDGEKDHMVVSGFNSKALYIMESDGLGCVDRLGPCPDDNYDEYIFGVRNLANLVDYDFLADGTSDSNSAQYNHGRILSLGGKADSIVVRDLNGDGNRDIAASVPETNQIAVFIQDDPTMGTAGRFREGLFIEPGKSPRSLVAGHYDKGNYTDFACIVDVGGTDEIAVIYNRGIHGEGDAPADFLLVKPRFTAPMALPMPVGFKWTEGRLSPTHMVVKDLNNDGAPDLVVATLPDPQDVTLPPNPPDLLGKDEEEGEEKSLPLILTFLSSKPAGDEALWFPTVPPIKQAPALAFEEPLVGMGVGTFDDQDIDPDLVIAIGGDPDGACDGRNFDVLRGGYDFDSVLPKAKLDGTGVDFYQAGPEGSYGFPGYFWPLGGYSGLSGISGLEVADLDGDGLDDVLVHSPQLGTPGTDGYKYPNAHAYLTIFNDKWETSAKCAAYPQTYFGCAPYWPMEQATEGLCKAKEEEPPPTENPQPEGENPGEEEEPAKELCQPNWDANLACIEEGVADPADEMLETELGFVPSAIAVADFDNNGCNDMLIADSGMKSVAYFRSLPCQMGVYSWHKDAPDEIWYTVGSGPVDIVAADFDDDGFLDAAIALAENVALMWGVDGDVFGNMEHLVKPGEDPIAPSSVEVGDVNSDDLPDILLTSPSTDEVLVYANGGGREFVGPYRMPAGKTPVKVAVEDMDADQCKDIIILNQGGRSVTVLRNLRCVGQ